MALFRATVSGAAPLRIQLLAGSSSLRIKTVTATGENSSGQASIPTVSIPSTPGTGSGVSQSLDGWSVSNATVITAFTGAPSNPVVNTGAFNLPMCRVQEFNGEIIVPPGGYLLLYANATGGHTWSGSILWDEGVD